MNIFRSWTFLAPILNPQAALPQVAFQQVKHSLRRPAIEAVKAANERDASRWTESWFSEAGQQQIREAVQKSLKDSSQSIRVCAIANKSRELTSKGFKCLRRRWK